MLRKFMKIGCLGMIVLLIVAWFGISALLSSGIKAGIVGFGPKVTGTEVSLNSVSVSPLSGKASMSGFEIANPEGFKSKRAFYLENGNIQIQIKSVFSDVIEIDFIHVDGAEITYELGLGKSNIGIIKKQVFDFLDSISEGGSNTDDAPTKKVIIHEFVFENCKVRPTATILQGISPTIPIPTIRLTGIGEKTQGETVSEAMRQIISPIFNAIDQVSGKAKDMIESLGDKVGDGAKKTIDTIKDIFDR